MSVLRSTLVAGLLACHSLPVQTADFADPTWPCLQRKVESLSLGLMWPKPVSEEDIRADLKPRATELVETLVLRRVPTEKIDLLVTEFVDSNPDLSDGDLGQIFRAAFQRINRERSKLIAGISRYSLTQIDLAVRIDDARNEMDALLTAAEPDYDRIDALEEQLDWDERIFHDRAQSLTYVCETPVLLEKRAFAIAQSLAQQLTE